MAKEQITNPILIEIFELNREKLNSLFNFYKFTYPVIEKDVVFYYIKLIIEPMVETYSNRDKNQLSVLVFSLYEKSLELIGKNFLGNSGRYPFFENKFIQCLEDSNEIIFENPDLYLSSISNAILKLGSSNIVKLETWISKFRKLTIKAKSIRECLEAGEVAAWVSGMPQYRHKALEISLTLDVDLLGIALGIANIKSINREKFITKLSSDLWMSPENALKENSPNKKFLLKRVGSFTGFGGEFITPPKVELIDHEFIISDSKNFYVLFTDIFGSHLQRISEDTYLTLATNNNEKELSNFSITNEGKVKFGSNELAYNPLSNFSSFAATGNTLCVTSPYSHVVYVIGLG
ncbi:MAG: hypothetical protein IPL26_03560 [Leptospiraceae bacterium]|nr:hypothetical protein [Leptospiraceae bacterium]